MLDYLIVGFGLSGSCLAHRLEKENKSFVVFENESQQSSKVAGGLYNPVVLKRFSLAWNADQQLAAALSFYRSLEEKLGTNFLKPAPIYRKFNSAEEQNNWFAAADKPNLENFLNTDLVKKHSKIPSDFGFGKVESTGTVDVRKMLQFYSDYLTKKNQLVKASFEHQLLKIESDYVQCQSIKARRIVFCEGFGMLQNPFFDYLPLQGNKGEYLIVEIPGLHLKEIIKASVFIIPLGNDRYKVGATYERGFENQLPSISAKEELAKKLEKIIDREYKIVGQVAGVRPTVPDRKPLLGLHPTHPNLYVCNGFGSRGVLIGPTAAQQLFDLMENQKPLPTAVDIQRF